MSIHLSKCLSRIIIISISITSSGSYRYIYEANNPACSLKHPFNLECNVHWGHDVPVHHFDQCHLIYIVHHSFYQNYHLIRFCIKFHLLLVFPISQLICTNVQSLTLLYSLLLVGIGVNSHLLLCKFYPAYICNMWIQETWEIKAGVVYSALTSGSELYMFQWNYLTFI